MKKIHFGFIIFIISSNYLFSNSFLFENRSTFYSMMNKQDTTVADTNEFVVALSPNKGSFKSPGKALLYSGVLPGMGQAYMGHWMRALLFVAVDGVAIGTWSQKNKEADFKKKDYKNYANEHWDIGRWIHDYYKWYPSNNPTWFSDDDSTWNAIRQVFVNKTDTISGCHEPPYCYLDIWDHSHSVEFTYDGRIMSSSSEDFKNIFKELCDNNFIFDTECSADVIDLKDSKGDTILLRTSHHFYEGIQKYDMFFAGWEDNEGAELITKPNGDKNVTSPTQSAYRKLWGDYNTIKTLAGNAGKFMFINRVVSMVDALLLAKKWNNEQNVILSLNVYPDLRNNFGVGGLKFSLHFQ